MARGTPARKPDSQARGARRMADIPPAHLAAMNRGERETRTLAEMLAVDFRKVLRSASPGADASRIDPAAGVTVRMTQAADALLVALGTKSTLRLREHASDIVRGWVCIAVGRIEGLTLAERLEIIRPLADDPHSGVREWAWMGVRPAIAAEVRRAIRLLTPWTEEASANLRRFATEATRPRGVWCAHIRELRAQPELGLPVLEPLRAAPEKYVQDSVANWLNDASKDDAAFVRRLCKGWLRESGTAATERICRRALRTVGP